MDLTTLIAYVFNCAVCTTIGTIFLLTPIQKDVQGKVDSFSKTHTTMPCRLGIRRGIYKPVVYIAHCHRRAASVPRPLHQPAVHLLRYMHRHDSHNLSAARQATQTAHLNTLCHTRTTRVAHTYNIVYTRLRTDLLSQSLQRIHHNKARHIHLLCAVCGVCSRNSIHPQVGGQADNTLQKAYRQLLLGQEPQPEPLAHSRGNINGDILYNKYNRPLHIRPYVGFFHTLDSITGYYRQQHGFHHVPQHLLGNSTGFCRQRQHTDNSCHNRQRH